MKSSPTPLHMRSSLSAVPEPEEDGALMAELRKHHPEIFGDEPRPRRARKNAKADVEPSLPPPDPSDDPAQRAVTLIDFISGTCALTLTPAAACSPAEREMYLTELLPLREALLAEFRASSPSDALLVDVAVAALFDSRRLAAKAASMLQDALPINIRASETVDRMAARAHARFIGAVEMLRRTRMPTLRLADEADQREAAEQIVALAGKRGR